MLLFIHSFIFFKTGRKCVKLKLVRVKRKSFLDNHTKGCFNFQEKERYSVSISYTLSLTHEMPTIIIILTFLAFCIPYGAQRTTIRSFQ